MGYHASYRARSVGRLALAAIAVAGGGVATPPSTASVTSTTMEYSCVVDEVVVDPDDHIAALEPGCTIELEAQAFGPGGLFDVFVSDDAGGYGGSQYIGPVSVSDGDSFQLEYTPGDSLPTLVTVDVSLDPHSEDYVCTGDNRGAVGRRVFPAASDAPECVVRFRVTDEVDLGELRFTVDYSASGAEIAGCGRGVACSSQVRDQSDSPFFTHVPYDSDSQRVLSLPALSGQGFSTPRDVYHCDVRKQPGADDPSPENFVVTVTGARTPAPLARPLVELPAVEAIVDCPPAVTTTTLPDPPAICGQPCSPEAASPKSRDALYVLSAAVGLRTCKSCICDVNRSGVVDATDALSILARAVGLEALLRCVQCAPGVGPSCQ